MTFPEPFLRITEGLFYTFLTPLLLCNFKRKLIEHIDDVRRGNSGAGTDISFVDEKQYSFAVWNDGKNEIQFNIPHVAKIAPDAVTKDTQNGTSENELELFITNLVRSTTKIPVPLCERVVPTDRGSLIVQEYIHGRTVRNLWPQLGWWMRLRIFLTLRYYIFELRHMHIRIGEPRFPGPPSRENVPQICKGRLFNFSSGSGPFQSYQEMARWYQNRLLVMQKYRNEGLGCAAFDDSGPLVFTHMDLHPLNLIMGDDGQLWVIDWENAGWYPPWFEAASMRFFTDIYEDTPLSWKRAIPFIAGSCDKPGQVQFMRAIMYSLSVLRANIINLIDSQETL